MNTITIILSDEEFKAIEAVKIEGADAWLTHAAKDLARRCMDRVIESNTTYRAKALNEAEKQAIIKPMELESAKDRKAREMAEIEAKIKAATDPKNRT